MKTTRKILIILALTLALVFTLCACDSMQIFDKLNNMVEADYSAINLEVKTEMGENTLTSTFNMAFDNDQVVINYTCQSLSIFENVDGQYVVPADYITTKIGACELRNGDIVSINGDLPVDAIQFEQIAQLGLQFNNQYFTQFSYTSDTFTARVKDVKGFMGSDVNAVNMTVAVTYSNVFESIVINYKGANNANITLTYTFA